MRHHRVTASCQTAEQTVTVYVSLNCNSSTLVPDGGTRRMVTSSPPRKPLVQARCSRQRGTLAGAPGHAQQARQMSDQKMLLPTVFAFEFHISNQQCSTKHVCCRHVHGCSQLQAQERHRCSSFQACINTFPTVAHTCCRCSHRLSSASKCSVPVMSDGVPIAACTAPTLLTGRPRRKMSTCSGAFGIHTSNFRSTASLCGATG
jgi:hypothetical protein